MAELPTQTFKHKALGELPNEVGVYALCDLDETPIYVGQSTDGIRARVRRHLTSARSDVIANRQIDVWEIAYVWAWPMSNNQYISPLEDFLFHELNELSPLVNGKIPSEITHLDFDIPAKVRIQIMEQKEIEARLDPALRFPRQIHHFGELVDYILNTQDKPHLRRALQVYYDRLSKYHNAFLGAE